MRPSQTTPASKSIALFGAPGVHTARYAGEHATYDDNVDKLLDVLGDRTDRAARFRTAIALVTPDGSNLVVEGVLEGVITKRRRGSAGFGYDPVFEVNGRTLAEVDPDEKNTMSHRALALRALVNSLTEPGTG